MAGHAISVSKAFHEKELKNITPAFSKEPISIKRENST
jgi:hypothetical protein